MDFLMLSKVTPVGKGFGADTALEGFLPAVDPLVAAEIAVVTEGLRTDVALEGPRARVSPLVYEQAVLPVVGLAALVALKRLLAGVDNVVIGQGLLALEQLETDLALVRLPGVHFAVAQQRTLLAEKLLAHLALIVLLLRVGPLVFGKRVGSPKRFRTHVALKSIPIF
jgi:hypothetical protein